MEQCLKISKRNPKVLPFFLVESGGVGLNLKKYRFDLVIEWEQGGLLHSIKQKQTQLDPYDLEQGALNLAASKELLGQVPTGLHTLKVYSDMAYRDAPEFKIGEILSAKLEVHE